MSKWREVPDGTVVYFPNDAPAAKGHEYLQGKVVEDNGDRVFVEVWDGTTYDVSKRKIAAYKKMEEDE
jgi:hypothetical protein